ncbi:hypothetical protein GEMRC1_004217 [Eukaryota sp. GEM-RC1]
MIVRFHDQIQFTSFISIKPLSDVSFFGLLIFLQLSILIHCLPANTELASCLCDLTGNYCDPFCCCDPDCSTFDIESFGDQCFRPYLSHPTVQFCPSNYNVRSVNFAVETADVATCVLYINTQLAGYFFPSPPTFSSSRASELLSEHPKSSLFPSLNPQPPSLTSFYNPLDHLGSSFGFAALPTSLGGSSCSLFPLSFLNNLNSYCSIPITSTSDCTSAHSFLNHFSILSSPDGTPLVLDLYSVDGDYIEPFSAVNDPVVDSDHCMSVINHIDLYLVHHEGTLTGGRISFSYNDVVIGSNNVLSVNVFYDKPRNETDHVTYKGGNPGYIPGRFVPVIPSEAHNQTDITFLTVSSALTDCDANVTSPVAFLRDFDSSCRVTVDVTDIDCNQVRSLALKNLKAQIDTGFLVSMYGNSTLEDDEHWISIHDVDMTVTDDSGFNGYCSSVPRSIQMLIMYTQSGSLTNPQYSIVAVHRRLRTFDWFPQCFTYDQCEDNVALLLNSRVSFVEYDADASPFVPPLPSFLPKFPRDWFHPFYKEQGRYEVTVGLIVVLSVSIVLALV